MNHNFIFTQHVANERNQQRAVTPRVYELLAFAEEVRAAKGARCCYFGSKSIRWMRAAGVCKSDIAMIESKRSLRIIMGDGGVVITVMHANQNNKRVRRHEQANPRHQRVRRNDR